MSTNTDELKIEEYSEKSIVVRGNTKNRIQAMKDLGGLYNARLRDGAGWIFSKNKRGDVESYISKLEKGEVSGVPYDIKSDKPSNSAVALKSEDRIIAYLEKLEKKIQELSNKLDQLSIPSSQTKKPQLSNYSDDDEDTPPAPSQRLLRRP